MRPLFPSDQRPDGVIVSAHRPARRGGGDPPVIRVPVHIRVDLRPVHTVGGGNRKDLEHIFQELGFSLNIRGETLSLEQFLLLSDRLETA
jgi:hypothetical protein